MANPRQLAAACLVDVEQGAYSNLIFKQRVAGADMDARDVQFCARLFYGALERTITLDYILAQYLDRGMDKLDAPVRAILRSGLYQALYMDTVPVAAAVDESVKLCRTFRKLSAAGLVNAVLRRAAEYDMRKIDGIADDIERLSVLYAVHPGIARMLRAQYGEETEDILAATLERAPTAVRVNKLHTTPLKLFQRLALEGIQTDPAPVQGGLLIRSGRYIQSAALADGSMRVQSVAAQYAVQQLALRPYQTLLDMCAAPGGKALTAAQIMANSGKITALDIHPGRLDLVQEQATREGIDVVETVCADAATYKSAEHYSAVLCDVPCSGYGEMARKPELRQKDPAQSAELPLLQAAILNNGAKLLKKGGRLVYSTCTLNKEENEAVVDAFLTQNDTFAKVAAKNLPPSAALVGDYVKFVPQKGYNEGFFIATLERM